MSGMYQVYKCGQTHFQIGDNTNHFSFDWAYVGSIAHAYLLAVGGQDQYVLHNFHDEPLSIHGPHIPSVTGPAVHGRQIALTSHDPAVPLPPVGAFNWHYIQCVLKKFASQDYLDLQNIYAFILPFRTDEDENFDDERNIEDPPYPSYYWDLAQLRRSERLEAKERDDTIMNWRSLV